MGSSRVSARAAASWSAAAVVATVVALSPACATAPSRSPSKAGKGSRVVEAVVVDRRYEPPGQSSGSARARSSGSWFLAFEARDGEATVHYEFPVSHQQYNHYPEGARVQLVLSDDELRDIRPVP